MVIKKYKMKLRQKILQEIYCDGKKLRVEILAKLKEQKVDFISERNNTIFFSNNFMKGGSNLKAMTTLKNGYFEINGVSDKKELLYVSYTSITGDIIAILICILLGIFISAFFYCGIFLFSIQFIFRIKTIRENNEDLMEEIYLKLNKEHDSPASAVL